ncbi:MAG TPA: endonuclease I, partial [Thiolinea sp.]|nr:endonuclease I [Thiolinea sp.]
MKFATFNLFQYVSPDYYWYERDPRNTYLETEWTQKQAWISQRLATMDADVLGFQEVFSVADLKQLC